MKTACPLFSGICLILLSVYLCACNKGKIRLNSNRQEAMMSSEPLDATYKPSSSSFRGLYVDNFAGILGRVSGEDSLLNWCLTNDLNALSLYNAATIIDAAATATLLNNFIGKAKGNPYNFRVALVATNLTITANQYNLYYKVYPNKFSAITTEYEFWNNGSGRSYTTFKNQLKYMNAINDSTAGALKRQVYVSRFTDAAGIVTDEATIAQRMVSSSDKIFLVNYVNNSYNLSNSTLKKIKKLANAAYALNKTIEIVILFNVSTGSSDPDIYNYFSVTGGNHPFMDAYANFRATYDTLTFSHKTNVKLIGFQLYKYSAAVSARPAI